MSGDWDEYVETDAFLALPLEQRLYFKNMMLTKDIEIERDRSRTWQKLAGRYDDIRYWLRLCDDEPRGHAKFYRECCLLIFGEYRDESRADD